MISLLDKNGSTGPSLLNMITWFLVVLVLFVWFHFKPDKRLLHYGELIPGPRRWPIVGTIFTKPRDEKDDLKFRERMYAEYGPICRMWLGNVLVVLLSDPKDVQVILQHPKEIKKSHIGYGFVKSWLGSGLILSSGELWASRRKALTPAFHFKILEQFMTTFNKRSSELIDMLKTFGSNEPVDVSKYVTKTTIDVINDTALGGKMYITDKDKSEYKEAVESMANIAMKRVSQPVFYSEFIWKYFGDSKRERRNLKTLTSIAEKIIERNEINISKEGENSRLDANDQDGYFSPERKICSLEIMLRLKLQSHPAFKTNADIIEEINTLFFAGHDTIASAVCFTLHLLARHPHVQENLYHDIKNGIHDIDNLKSSDIQCLPYLEMVLKEALRLYPSVPVIGRHITTDLVLPSGYTLPSNTLVAVSIYHVHRHPNSFDKPLEFNPDNFLPDAVAKRHPYTYIPFSAGPRNCIGQKFAILETKTILVKIMRHFKVLCPDGAPKEITPYGSLVLQTEEGHEFVLVER